MKNPKTKSINEKTAYQMAGEGDTTILLVHGIPSSLDEWKFLLPELVSAGYRAIAMDLLGHGNSFKPENPRYYTVDAAYDFFDEWASSLDIDTPMALVGHSFGGHIVIKYALNHPDKVRALILIDPFLSFRQFSWIYRLLFSNPAPAAFLYKIIPSALIKSFVWMENTKIAGFQILSDLPPGEIAAMVNDYKRCSANVAYFPRSVSDQAIDYAKIKPPTLLIWGKKDHTLSTSWYKEIVSKLPDCTFKILNARHYPHRTNYPEVNARILEFLKSNSI